MEGWEGEGGIGRQRTSQDDTRLIAGARTVLRRHGHGEVREDRVEDEVVAGEGLGLGARLAHMRLHGATAAGRVARVAEAAKGLRTSEGRREQQELHVMLGDAEVGAG